MAVIPTPQEAKPIPDFASGTFDGDSLLFQSRNGTPGKVDGDDVATYIAVSKIFSGLGTTNKGLVGAINEVNAKAGAKFIVVQTLPSQDIDTAAIYLVPSSDPQTQNIYDEYIYITTDDPAHWEKIGTTEIDLSNYYTKTEADALLAGKEPLGTWLTQTLTAGATSLTFTNAAILADSIIQVFTQPEIYYNSLTASVGSVVLTFDAQASDVSVKVRVR